MKWNYTKEAMPVDGMKLVAFRYVEKEVYDAWIESDEPIKETDWKYKTAISRIERSPYTDSVIMYDVEDSDYMMTECYAWADIPDLPKAPKFEGEKRRIAMFGKTAEDFIELIPSIYGV